MTEQITDQLADPIESYDDDVLSRPPPAWPKWIGGLAIAWAHSCSLVQASEPSFSRFNQNWSSRCSKAPRFQKA